MRLRVGFWRKFGGPHVKGGPFVTCVWGGAEIEAEDEDSEPESSGGDAQFWGKFGGSERECGLFVIALLLVFLPGTVDEVEFGH